MSGASQKKRPASPVAEDDGFVIVRRASPPQEIDLRGEAIQDSRDGCDNDMENNNVNNSEKDSSVEDNSSNNTTSNISNTNTNNNKDNHNNKDNNSPNENNNNNKNNDSISSKSNVSSINSSDNKVSYDEEYYHRLLSFPLLASEVNADSSVLEIKGMDVDIAYHLAKSGVQTIADLALFSTYHPADFEIASRMITHLRAFADNARALCENWRMSRPRVPKAEESDGDSQYPVELANSNSDNTNNNNNNNNISTSNINISSDENNTKKVNSDEKNYHKLLTFPECAHLINADSSVREIKGINEETADLLAFSGVKTIADLSLFSTHNPKDFELACRMIKRLRGFAESARTLCEYLRTSRPRVPKKKESDGDSQPPVKLANSNSDNINNNKNNNNNNNNKVNFNEDYYYTLFKVPQYADMINAESSVLELKGIDDDAADLLALSGVKTIADLALFSTYRSAHFELTCTLVEHLKLFADNAQALCEYWRTRVPKTEESNWDSHWPVNPLADSKNGSLLKAEYASVPFNLWASVNRIEGVTERLEYVLNGYKIKSLWELAEAYPTLAPMIPYETSILPISATIKRAQALKKLVSDAMTKQLGDTFSVEALRIAFYWPSTGVLSYSPTRMIKIQNSAVTFDEENISNTSSNVSNTRNDDVYARNVSSASSNNGVYDPGNQWAEDENNSYGHPAPVKRFVTSRLPKEPQLKPTPFMPPQKPAEPVVAQPPTASDPSLWYLKPEYVEKNITLDSSIDILKSARPVDIQFLNLNGFVTIRHLYDSAEEIKILAPLDEGHKYDQMLLEASHAVNRCLTLRQEKNESERLMDNIWVFQYVSESVYEQIKQEKQMNSPYVMFNQYLQCATSERHFHAWQRVHHQYARDAAKWMGRRVDDIDSITAADIYSFLVWRASNSYGQYDCTAGPKAIYFSWAPMPEVLRRDAMAIDQVSAEDTRDPFIADRYARVIYINLAKLVREYGGKIHRVETSAQNPKKVSNTWLSTNLEQAYDLVRANERELWENFESGESFQSVPHGCIVLAKGTIPFDCLKFD